MSNSPRLLHSPAPLVFFDPLSAPKLSRSPRLPRQRNTNHDHSNSELVPLFSPCPQTLRRNHPPPPSVEGNSGDKSAAAPKRHWLRHLANVVAVAALPPRSVDERTHVPNPNNPATAAPSIKEYLRKQRQRFSTFTSKFLQKLVPTTSPRPHPRPRPSSETSCCPFPSAKPGLQTAHVAVVVVEKEDGSSRSRCSQKQSMPRPRPALDYAWVPVALLGLCFGFSTAIPLAVCWFYSFPVIKQVLELQHPRSAPKAGRARNSHAFRLGSMQVELIRTSQERSKWGCLETTHF